MCHIPVYLLSLQLNDQSNCIIAVVDLSGGLGAAFFKPPPVFFKKLFVFYYSVPTFDTSCDLHSDCTQDTCENVCWRSTCAFPILVTTVWFLGVGSTVGSLCREVTVRINRLMRVTGLVAYCSLPTTHRGCWPPSLLVVLDEGLVALILHHGHVMVLFPTLTLAEEEQHWRHTSEEC